MAAGGKMGALVGAFAVGVFDFLASFFGRRVAVVAAVGGLYFAALGVLLALISSAMSGLVQQLPANGLWHWLLVGINLALPGNFVVCLTALLTAEVGVFLYRWNNAHVIGVASST
jgi:hypothetical protein